MSNTDLMFRIELLDEQIENLNHSGHFTDKEIEAKLHPLERERESLINQLTVSGELPESCVDCPKNTNIATRG